MISWGLLISALVGNVFTQSSLNCKNGMVPTQQVCTSVIGFKCWVEEGRSLKNDYSMDMKCAEIGSYCNCAPGLINFENTTCITMTEINNTCMERLSKAAEETLVGGGIVTEEYLKKLATCKGNENVIKKGQVRLYSCNGSEVVNKVEVRDFKDEYTCVCSGKFGDLNGDCVEESAAVAYCKSQKNETTPNCAENEHVSTQSCAEQHEYACSLSNGKIDYIPKRMCNPGNCYCPTTHAIYTNGSCITKDASLQLCLDAFNAQTGICREHQRLSNCEHDVKFKGCKKYDSSAKVPPTSYIVSEQKKETVCSDKNVNCMCVEGTARIADFSCKPLSALEEECKAKWDVSAKANTTTKPTTKKGQ